MASTDTRTPMTKQQVLLWISEHFVYYHSIVLTLATVQASSMPGHRADIEDPLSRPALVFYPKVDAAFRDVSVPLLLGHLQKDNVQKHWIYWISCGKWSIASEAAEIVSSRERARALESASTKPFRFQVLPAELRVAIYELVLLLPKSGISLQVDPLEMRAFSRKFQTTVEAANVFPVLGRQRRPETPSLLDVPRHFSAILGTSNSVYKEAAPIFYGDNLFVFDRLAQLYEVLRRLSPDRASMIRQVAIQYSVHDRDIGRNAFRALGNKLTGLRELKLWMNESEWATATIRYRGTER
ncbi:hypothetical protein Slin15195_G120400 [Septoria linicola]|uniref:DUF7730 domain-containing protein n=1 Tax=Septoria linicola TaxID=215465 RepID=A0A9Q9B9B9_9PEZI|nr:hypothetical protein Slin15195_G120400 [Septoria linicola]